MKTAALGDFCGHILIPRVWMAEGFWSRGRGLLGRDRLDAGEALYLAPCHAVHTLGMRFALDLVFVDRNLRVRRMLWNVPPGRCVWGGLRSHGVLEMQAGWFPREALRVGAALCWASGQDR